MFKRNITIVAEAGINHNGSMGAANSLIYMAKEAGADIVKFQLYDPLSRIDIDIHSYKEILIQSRISKREVYYLKSEADRAGIELMFSVFEPYKVEWTEAIGIKKYKIASKSIHDIELAKAIADTNKPVILSFGMRDEKQSIAIYKYPKVEVLRMYCVSKYPTDFSDLDLSDIPGIYDGFSDHTIGISASLVAMSIGASVIEKHITLDKTMQGPDHLLSLDFNELALLCKLRDDIERINR